MLAKTEITISDNTIRRLTLYLRSLNELNAIGRTTVSSRELARRLDARPAQIRKDLSCFGGFGKQGIGYPVSFLIFQLERLLKIDKQWDVAVVGLGNLGIAIGNYSGFASRGFRIAWLFDRDPQCVGQEISGLTVLSMKDLESTLLENNIKIGMITVPSRHAQEVANRLVGCGVRALLNYAPLNLSVPDHVFVQDIDPVMQLQRMTYYM
ncbi:MAG: redox-sensing transcriptional repressor Rex [Chloroflexota bacterium]